MGHRVVVADYERSDVFARNLRLRGCIHEQLEGNFGFRQSEALIDATIGVDVVLLDAAAGVDGALLARFRAAMLD